MSLVAVLDTCVLFSAPLRDTLLRADNAHLYELRLTDDILEELRRNLIKRGVSKGITTEKNTQRLISTLRERFAGRFVTDYQDLIESMPINTKDRHVMAAAVASKAQVIVTSNLKDFPAHLLASYRVEALSPDQFLLRLFHSKSQQMTKILLEQAAYLHKPPMTIFEVLDRLRQDAPNFVQFFCNKFETLDL